MAVEIGGVDVAYNCGASWKGKVRLSSDEELMELMIGDDIGGSVVFGKPSHEMCTVSVSVS
jgi:hypothetical protein